MTSCAWCSFVLPCAAYGKCRVGTPDVFGLGLHSVHPGVVCPYPSLDVCAISCATPRSTAMLELSEVDGSVSAAAMLDK